MTTNHSFQGNDLIDYSGKFLKEEPRKALHYVTERSAGSVAGILYDCVMVTEIGHWIPKADCTMHVPNMQIPTPDSRWLHKNGQYYTVLMIANNNSYKPAEFPVMVVYRNEQQQVWARPLTEWHRSMKEVKVSDEPVS